VLCDVAEPTNASSKASSISWMKDKPKKKAKHKIIFEQTRVREQTLEPYSQMCEIRRKLTGRAGRSVFFSFSFHFSLFSFFSVSECILPTFNSMFIVLFLVVLVAAHNNEENFPTFAMRFENPSHQPEMRGVHHPEIRGEM